MLCCLLILATLLWYAIQIKLQCQWSCLNLKTHDTLYSIPLIYNDHFYLFFCGEKTEHPQPLTLEDCIAIHVCLLDKPTMISQVVIYHMGDNLTLNAHIVSLTLFFFNPLVTIFLKADGNPKVIPCVWWYHICFIGNKSRFHMPNIAFMSLEIVWSDVLSSTNRGCQ